MTSYKRAGLTIKQTRQGGVQGKRGLQRTIMSQKRPSKVKHQVKMGEKGPTKQQMNSI